MNASERLIRKLFKLPDACKQIDRIMTSEVLAEIDGEFLGFLEQYEALAKIIPRNRVVYDFGAAYGFQSWYFRFHKRYIAIQPSEVEHFQTDNAIWFCGTTQEYLERFGIEPQSFAIVNYVPGDSMRLVKEQCPYVFVYYTERGDIL